MVVVLGGIWCWLVMIEDGFGSGTVSFGRWRYWGDKVGGVGEFFSRLPEYGTIANWRERWRVSAVGGSVSNIFCPSEGLDG